MYCHLRLTKVFSFKSFYVPSGLNFVKEILGDYAFFKKGAPGVFLTDDCEAERSAIAQVFPSTERFLCIFHVLQAVWRYLCDAKSGVKKADGPEILIRFRKCLYATTSQEFNIFSSDILSLTSVATNSKILK